MRVRHAEPLRRAGLSDADITLGDRLVEQGALDPAGLARAIKLAETGNGRLPHLLTSLGLVQEDALATTLCLESGLPLAGEADFPAVPVLPYTLNARFLRRVKILPLEDRADRLRLAVADPLDHGALDAIKIAVHKPVELLVSTQSKIGGAVERLYFPNGGAEAGSLPDDFDASIDDDLERLKGLASEAPVIRTVNGLIDRAVELGASDIHVEPDEAQVTVRYRVDGQLCQRDPLPF